MVEWNLSQLSTCRNLTPWVILCHRKRWTAFPKTLRGATRMASFMSSRLAPRSKRQPSKIDDWFTSGIDTWYYWYTATPLNTSSNITYKGLCWQKLLSQRCCTEAVVANQESYPLASLFSLLVSTRYEQLERRP